MSKYIIVGPAASGKDWLQKKFIEKGYKPLVLYTTRPRRPNEDGTEYHFVSNAVMGNLISENIFLSLKSFNSWWYGFTKEDFVNSDVAILTVSNLEDIRLTDRNLLNDKEIVYLDIDEEVRRARLDARYTGGNADDTTERRLNADREDFKDFDSYTIKLQTAEAVEKFINNVTRKN